MRMIPEGHRLAGTVQANQHPKRMATQVTQDIRISVKATYSEAQSDPKVGRFLFGYRIRIENRGSRTVQLMRRHWHIVDSLFEHREVKGPGVVGATPVLAPGDHFSYSSFCDLKSGFGRMHGSYTMRHMDDGSTFEVVIPEFDLVYPIAAN
jgi:ApaG protein